jgi:hypothetical protein
MQTIQTQNQRTPVSQIPGIGTMDALYLWHCYRFATGDTPGLYGIFNAIKGQAGSNGFTLPLTDRETSLMSNPSQTPLDQKIICFDFGVELVASKADDGPYGAVSVADAAACYDMLQLVFIRGATQTIPLGPISLYPGGSGITAAVDASNAATTAAGFNGLGSSGARRRLSRALILNPGDTWSMALEIANSDKVALTLDADFVDVRVSMWAYRDLGLSG